MIWDGYLDTFFCKKKNIIYYHVGHVFGPFRRESTLWPQKIERKRSTFFAALTLARLDMAAGEEPCYHRIQTRTFEGNDVDCIAIHTDTHTLFYSARRIFSLDAKAGHLTVVQQHRQRCSVLCPSMFVALSAWDSCGSFHDKAISNGADCMITSEHSIPSLVLRPREGKSGCDLAGKKEEKTASLRWKTMPPLVLIGKRCLWHCVGTTWLGVFY